MSKWFVGQMVRVYNEEAVIVDLREGQSVFKGEFEVKYTDGDLGIVHPNDITPIDDFRDDSGPIRTVTRREIVPGVYGRVHVGPTDVDSVVVSIGGLGIVGQVQRFTSEELREAAHIFNQLAEALDDA